jgi:hypothetical protein
MALTVSVSSFLLRGALASDSVGIVTVGECAVSAGVGDVVAHPRQPLQWVKGNEILPQ